MRSRALALWLPAVMLLLAGRGAVADTLYVAEDVSGSGVIMQFDTTTPGVSGGAVFLPIDSLNAGQLDLDGFAGAFMYGLAVGPDGDIYVAERTAGFDYGQVQRFTPDGSEDPAPGQEGTAIFVAAGSGGLIAPCGMAFDTSGNLYVLGNTAIYRYDQNGLPNAAPDGASGVYASIPGNFGIGGIAFGPDGNLYATNIGGGNNILEISGPGSANPGTVSVFIEQGAGAGVPGFNEGGLDVPFSVAFGPDGNLWVGATTGGGSFPTEFGADSVLEFGGPLSANPGQPLQGFTLLQPTDNGGAYIGFGASGTLFWGDQNTSTISSYSGGTVTTFATGLSNPKFFALDPAPAHALSLVLSGEPPPSAPSLGVSALQFTLFDLVNEVTGLPGYGAEATSNSGSHFSYATAINDVGEVAGTVGFADGNSYGFVYNPVGGNLLSNWGTAVLIDDTDFVQPTSMSLGIASTVVAGYDTAGNDFAGPGAAGIITFANSVSGGGVFGVSPGGRYLAGQSGRATWVYDTLASSPTYGFTFDQGESLLADALLGVNDDGVSVGADYNGDTGNFGGASDAVVWPSVAAIDLLPSGTSPTPTTLLAAPSDGAYLWQAVAINNAGWIVLATRDSATQDYLAVPNNGGYALIGLLPASLVDTLIASHSSVTAAAINGAGEVVGSYSINEDKQYGFVWVPGPDATNPGNGSTFVTIDPPDGLAGITNAGLQLSGINDQGDLAGTLLLPGGSHPIYLVPNPPATTTTLSASQNPATVGQAITFSISVAANFGSGIPTGTVQLFNGSTPLGAATLSGGTASIPVALGVGVYTNLNATYSGDANGQASVSSAFSETVVQATSATALAVTPQSVVVGNSQTVEATVTGDQPTGLVTFTDTSATPPATLGSAMLAGGTAAISTTLPVGTHSITASYAGDGNNTASTSSASSTVAPASTSTSLSSSVNPASAGQAVVFTATVSNSSGGGTPTGTVAFAVAGNALGAPVSLNQGVATLSTAALPIAPAGEQITAAYTPDSTNFTGSTSTLTEVVDASGASVEVELSSSRNPSGFGEPVRLRARVLETPKVHNAPLPTGAVSFAIDGGAPQVVALDRFDMATLRLDGLAVGSHQVVATYGGDASYSPASSTLTQVVDEDATSTVLDSSPNPSVAGETVAVRVHVETSHSGGRKPTGAVSLSVDGTPQSLALDASGAAAVDLSALSAGTHTLGARYAGDGDFLGSDATPITQTVVLAATTTTLAASRTSAVFGQPIDVTVKVRAEGPHVGTPAGTVTFTVDGASQAVALDASGSAALSLSLAVGAHTIGASYSGDAGFAASDAGSLSLVVTQAETRTTLSSSANPATSGAAITFSAAVKATGAGSGSPSGTVTFRDGAAVLGSAALDTSGTALLTAPSLAVGSHSITAAYSGDASFAASASAALTETVKAGKY